MKMISVEALAASLADGSISVEVLSEVLSSDLPFPPLDLLVALHAQVTEHMRDQQPYAAQAADAAWIVAEHYADDLLLRAQAHWSRGSAILYQPDYDQALRHYDAALHCYQQAASAYAPALPPRDIRIVEIARVFCLNELGKFPEALAAVAAAEDWLIENPLPTARLILLLNRSLLAGNMGDYTGMLELADAVIRLANELDQPADRAMGWINRAYACIFLERFDEAEEALAHGLSDARLAKEALTEARGLLNRAWLLHRQGHIFDALTMLREAEQGMKRAPNEAATVALEAATIYEQLRQLGDAQRAAVRAANLFAGQRMPMYSAEAYLQAARIAAQRGRASEALRLLEQARDQASDLHHTTLDAEIAVGAAFVAALPKPPMPYSARRDIRTAAQAGVATLAAAGMARAASEGQLAIAALDTRLGNRRRARLVYQSLVHHSNRAIQIEAHAQLGALLPADEVYSHLCAAADLVIEQRRTLPMEELQARYSSETAHHHMRLARYLLERGDTATALHRVWEAKAGPLIDLRTLAAGLDVHAQAQIDHIRAELVRLREQERKQRHLAAEAAQLGEQERAALHSAEMRAAADAVEATEQILTDAMRALADRVGQGSIPSLAEVWAALTFDRTLLEYARLEDELVCFVVQPGVQPVCRRLGPFAAIAGLINRWDLVRNSSLAQRFLAETEQRRQHIMTAMADRLITPLHDLLGDTQCLLIAPTDVLYHIPWAALRAGTTVLAEQFCLTLTPSGALWATGKTSPTATAPPLVLGYAGTGERSLHGVADELRAIAHALPDGHVVVEASSADLHASPPPRLLHIAAHGVTRPDAPICSYLELADGPFLLLEAHRLDLHGTELVTLSACETGERPSYGEMALALAGAFLCAGAMGVLASLWAIEDRAAAALMAHFYARFAAGVPAAEALRDAQRMVRDTYPLDWAAFQVWAGIPVYPGETENDQKAV